MAPPFDFVEVKNYPRPPKGVFKAVDILEQIEGYLSSYQHFFHGSACAVLFAEKNRKWIVDGLESKSNSQVISMVFVTDAAASFWWNDGIRKLQGSLDAQDSTPRHVFFNKAARYWERASQLQRIIHPQHLQNRIPDNPDDDIIRYAWIRLLNPPYTGLSLCSKAMSVVLSYCDNPVRQRPRLKWNEYVNRGRVLITIRDTLSRMLCYHPDLNKSKGKIHSVNGHPEGNSILEMTYTFVFVCYLCHWLQFYDLQEEIQENKKEKLATIRRVGKLSDANIGKYALAVSARLSEFFQRWRSVRLVFGKDTSRTIMASLKGKSTLDLDIVTHGHPLDALFSFEFPALASESERLPAPSLVQNAPATPSVTSDLRNSPELPAPVTVTKSKPIIDHEPSPEPGIVEALPEATVPSGNKHGEDVVDDEVSSQINDLPVPPSLEESGVEIDPSSDERTDAKAKDVVSDQSEIIPEVDESRQTQIAVE